MSISILDSLNLHLKESYPNYKVVKGNFSDLVILKDEESSIYYWEIVISMDSLQIRSLDVDSGLVGLASTFRKEILNLQV